MTVDQYILVDGHLKKPLLHDFANAPGEFDDDLRELIGELGWAAFGQQSGPMGESSDLTLLPRFPMAGFFAAMETFPEMIGTRQILSNQRRPSLIRIFFFIAFH